jgi:hypothetical protein
MQMGKSTRHFCLTLDKTFANGEFNSHRKTG